MRFGGEHWTGYPPDDPPQSTENGPWCSRHGRWECDDCEAFAEEMDELKRNAQRQLPEPKIWGGQLLGWTTQREIDALEESIKHDY